jgi:hypothetical protein
MRHTIWYAAVAVTAMGMIAASGAKAHESRVNRRVYAPAAHTVVLPPAEGVGCFWHLGHRSCSRYCYWEVDGYRYCTTHERDAHTQAIHPFAEHHGAAIVPVRRGPVLK